MEIGQKVLVLVNSDPAWWRMEGVITENNAPDMYMVSNGKEKILVHESHLVPIQTDDIDIHRAKTDPIYFAEKIGGIQLKEWQKESLKNLKQGTPITNALQELKRKAMIDNNTIVYNAIQFFEKYGDPTALAQALFNQTDTVKKLENKLNQLQHSEQSACNELKIENIEMHSTQDDNVIHVELYYPKNNKVDTLEVGLCAVRAVDDIRIRFDFDRDGWTILQSRDYYEKRNGEENSFDLKTEWIESAFLPAWQFELEDNEKFNYSPKDTQE